MDQRTFISVILPLKLEWEASYRVEADETVCVGDRVRVMFANRKYMGVVSGIGIKPDIEASKVLPVISIEREMERILPEEIALWRQVADYYLCTVGEVYKAAYPTEKVSNEEARAGAVARAQQRRERLAEGIRGKIARLELRLEKKTEQAARAKDGTKAKTSCLTDIEKINKDLVSCRSALETALKSIESVRRTEVCTELPEKELRLTEAQENAYISIKKGFASSKPVLLHGVTGSGKTEIYIRLAKETLREGRNVLYLVPEIALSRQLESRLKEHFGDMMMVFHSGESSVSRRDTADRLRHLRDKGNYLVLGTRSSLFLPHNSLGLIIVDEEHDTSYKQDSPAPRYHGRDTALMMALLQKSDIIMGSATPSLEESYNCLINKHIKVELHERYHGSMPADVQIIDTRAERRKNGMKGSISRKLADLINGTLEEKGQILVLRSRRAWATALQCQTCGEIQKCPHCNVSLSYHKESDSTSCHYCGYNSHYDGKCGKCGGRLDMLGAGTQKIEEEIAAMFPHARVARLDSDTSQNSRVAKGIIRGFENGDTDILVGTQILAKGFDFSRLSLVAVIAADSLLGIQDFRADEKAFDLLEQFRGRCGRREKRGLFVIQTSQPDHPIYRRIMENDSNALYSGLMEERKDFNFPPFSRIVEITLRDTNGSRLEIMAARLSNTLRNETGSVITGPYTPAVSRIADNHIRKIRINLKKDRQLKFLKSRIRKSVREMEKSSGYDGHIIIDVDPS